VPDIHERIRHIREDRKLTREAFGTSIGASVAKVQALENGRQRVDHVTLEALSRNLGVDANWLLLGGDNHRQLDAPEKNTVSISPVDLPDFVPIERFSVEASAGGGALVDEETLTGSYAFNRRWLDRRQLNPESLAVIAVRGDSMEPKLSDGDLILVDRAQKQIADGIAYVLRLGSDLLVKYVQRIGPSKVSLLSANTFYPPREIDAEGLDGEVEIIGRVVASMHEW
jgi:phage repressor protein C with HTH and peptisase S24 domain